jgi:3-hydroxybutyrate dehydrogenase
VNLAGKRALITGSTSGIGLAIAEVLADNGCAVILNGFGDEHEIARIRRYIMDEFSVQATYVAADVSQEVECRRLALAALDLGGVDILVNNAGIQHIAPIEDFPVERWDSILATNLSSAFHLTRYLLPLMRQKQWGRIVNVASVHGLVASKDKSAYVAAKHGLIGLSKVIALETAGQGITCNAICPGWVLTPLVEAQIQQRVNDENLDRDEVERMVLQEKQPSGQFTTKAQVGQFVAYLCSEHASNLTGASVPLDGGWTAQ